MELIINELHTELLDPTEPASPAEPGGEASGASGDLPIATARALALRDERRARLADD